MEKNKDFEKWHIMVKVALARRGKTVKTMAADLGYSANHVYNVLNMNKISQPLVNDIADYLDIDPYIYTPDVTKEIREAWTW